MSILVVCLRPLFSLLGSRKKKNSHIYALVEISFTVSWIQSLYDVESIQGFGRLGVATACCTFIGRNDLSYCHRASNIGFKHDTLYNLSFEVRSILVLFWCNCPQNCCNMPIKQLDSSDRFYQNLFRSGRAFKSLQSSSIKMTMWCPFISSPWMVYPIWHSNCQ